jgi:Lrp/AsnC family transcriptional regulator, regulator for asnA, asnC and gidA
MYQIDTVDIEIVNLLMEDGRLSAAVIARKIGGISERAVRYRIEKMVEDGIIRISAIVNPKSLGFFVVADVMLEVESDSIQEVAQRMALYECVSYVAYAIGDTDLSVQVVAHDNNEVYRFVTEVIGKTPGVRKTSTMIVPHVLKDVYQWHVPTTPCKDIPSEDRSS